MGDLNTYPPGDASAPAVAEGSLGISASKLDIYRTAFTRCADNSSSSTSYGLATRYIALPDHHVVEAQAYRGNLAVRELDPSGRTVATYNRDRAGVEQVSVLDPVTKELVPVQVLPAVQISQK